MADSVWGLWSPAEKKVMKVSTTLLCVFGIFVGYLGAQYGYGERSLTDYTGLAYDTSLAIAFTAGGICLGLVIVAAIRDRDP